MKIKHSFAHWGYKPEMEEETEKVCSLCKKKKAIDEFGWANNFKLRRQARCRKCINKVWREKYGK